MIKGIIQGSVSDSKNLGDSIVPRIELACPISDGFESSDTPAWSSTAHDHGANYPGLPRSPPGHGANYPGLPRPE